MSKPPHPSPPKPSPPRPRPGDNRPPTKPPAKPPRGALDLRAYGAQLAHAAPPLPAWAIDAAAAIYVAAHVEAEPKTARPTG